MSKKLILTLITFLGAFSDVTAEVNYGYAPDGHRNGLTCFGAVTDAAQRGYYRNGGCDCVYAGRWECRVGCEKRTTRFDFPAFGASDGFGSSTLIMCDMAKYDTALLLDGYYLGICACEG